MSTNSPASMLSANMDAASLLDQSETPDEARKRSVSWPVAPSMSGGPDALSPLATSPNAAPPHVSNLQPASSPVASPSGKSKKAPRRNPWGAESYADLISKAILSTKDKRMTLNQIYEWMVDNVAHFKDKGDSNSAAGWKVSAATPFDLWNSMNCPVYEHLQTYSLPLFLSPPPFLLPHPKWKNRFSTLIQ